MRHHREPPARRIGPDAALWQLTQMSPEQMREALIYLSARNEKLFALAILWGRGDYATASDPMTDPVEHIRAESIAGETRDNPPQMCTR